MTLGGGDRLPKVKEARQLSQSMRGESRMDVSALGLGCLTARRDDHREDFWALRTASSTEVSTSHLGKNKVSDIL